VTYTASRTDISLGINSDRTPAEGYNGNFTILTQVPASGGGYEGGSFYSASGLGSNDIPNDTFAIKYVSESSGGIEYYKNDIKQFTSTLTPSGDYYVTIYLQGLDGMTTSEWTASATK
jgi:hypothetical protein